jgi:hypothetical protein
MKYVKSPAVYNHITEMVNCVCGLNTLVPQFNHGFIHLVGVIPRTKFSYSVRTEKPANALVTKMGIAN